MKNSIKKVTVKILKKTSLYKIWKDRKNETILKTLKKIEEDKLIGKENSKIEVINLNANDICNSKCVMCNIWEQKMDYEISPKKLEEVLKDPLFENVKHVGVTGGEPTLRDDLPQLFEAIISALPKVTGLSTITNCIKEKDVKDRIESVIDICKKNGKSFSMMISLDGYKEIHDKVRGRTGNFESAINVLNHFKHKGIPVTIGCTISKVNVWEVDELLDFMKENKYYGRFRIAEFINRLYNNNRTNAIRNFDEDETYHLILFFYKLIYTYEKNAIYKRTYKSIISILSGGQRLIGCPYHEKGVVLNSRGEIAYCAPKSKIIGNTLEKSAKEIYNKNLAEKKRIIENDCDSCIHDYHAPITYNEKLKEILDLKWKNYINVNNKFKSSLHKKITAKKVGNYQIFITGWYGTETVGDKAILGGIIEELLEKYGKNITLIVTSIFPIITKRTLEELNIEANVINAYSEDFIAYAKGADIIIMGGGPLMDLDELALPLIAFRIGKIYKIKNIIYGCGLGPLYLKKNQKVVQEILNSANEIKLRDNKSIELAQKWLKTNCPVEFSGDPAMRYLKKYINIKLEEKNVLTCFLREWTYEYARNLSYEEFKILKLRFEKALSAFIINKAKELKVEKIIFEHMHNFVIGNDDRDFSRYFIKNYFKNLKDITIEYNHKLSTVDSIVKSMKSSQHNISMRFHSVVFADKLDTSYTAIDYTNGGKIANFLRDNQKLDNLLSVEDIINFNESMIHA